MQTYLQLHQENTGIPQAQFRGRYPLCHMDYEFDRTVGRTGEAASDIRGGEIRVAFEGVEIYDGWEQDGRTFGYNTQKQITGAAYGITEGIVGAALGAKIGFAFGALFGGVGAVPGAIIGGFLGGYFLADYAEKEAEKIYETFETGWGSTTTQTITWYEEIYLQ